MTSCETKVINKSDSEVVLKLSNAGTHFELSTIKKDGCAIIKCEPNATYREYWVGTVNVEGGNPIIISSDDCLEHHEILIKNGRDVPSKLVVEMVRRATDTGHKSGLGSRILEKLGFGGF